MVSRSKGLRGGPAPLTLDPIGGFNPLISLPMSSPPDSDAPLLAFQGRVSRLVTVSPIAPALAQGISWLSLSMIVPGRTLLFMILTVCVAAQTSVVTAQVRALPKPIEPIRPTPPTIRSIPPPVNSLPPTTINRPLTVPTDQQTLSRAPDRTVRESGMPVSAGGGNDSLEEHEHGHPHENQEAGDSGVTDTTSVADPVDTTLFTAPPNPPPPAEPSPPSSNVAPPQERPNPNHTVELLVAMLLCLMLLFAWRRSARG